MRKRSLPSAATTASLAAASLDAATSAAGSPAAISCANEGPESSATRDGGRDGRDDARHREPRLGLEPLRGADDDGVGLERRAPRRERRAHRVRRDGDDDELAPAHGGLDVRRDGDRVGQPKVGHGARARAHVLERRGVARVELPQRDLVPTPRRERREHRPPSPPAEHRHSHGSRRNGRPQAGFPRRRPLAGGFGNPPRVPMTIAPRCGRYCGRRSSRRTARDRRRRARAPARSRRRGTTRRRARS